MFARLGKKISPFIPTNSFTKENIDELINNIDEVEQVQPLVTPNHSNANNINNNANNNTKIPFSVDELLNRFDELESQPSSPERKQSNSPHNEGNIMNNKNTNYHIENELLPSIPSNDEAVDNLPKLVPQPSARLAITPKPTSKSNLFPHDDDDFPAEKRLMSSSGSKLPLNTSVYSKNKDIAPPSSSPNRSTDTIMQRFSPMQALKKYFNGSPNTQQTPSSTTKEEDLSDEGKLRSLVEDRFKVLMNQVIEFHVRLREATVKVHDYERLRSDLEVSLDDMERQNLLLQNRLQNRDSNLSKLGTRSEKFARGNDARRAALLFEAQQEDFAFKFNFLKKKESIFAQWEQIVLDMIPFGPDVRKIQSRFGSSVAAYFEFYRFMYAQFCLVSSVSLVLCGFHLFTLVRNGEDIRMFSSKGVVPGFMLFSSFHTSENLIYSCIIVSGCLVFIISLFFQVIYKDRMSKEMDAIEAQSNTVYAKDVLCSWDFSLLNPRQKDEFSGTFSQEMLQRLSDTKVGAAEKKRTTQEFAILMVKRVFGTVLYMGLQLGTMTAILYITISAVSIKDNVSGVSFLRSLAPFLSGIALSLINASLPVFLKYLTLFEAWDNPTLELNILLFRMYFSNIFNILILAGSYALLADPFLLAEKDYHYYRTLLEISFNSSSNVTRMDQVAEGLYSLLLTAFVIKLLMVILNPLADVIWDVVFDVPVEKTEFNISSSIVSMLYLGTVAMLLFPYAPLCIISMPPMLAILIKWEKYIMLRLYSAPKRPWKAQKAGEVFSIFYLVSFFLVGIPSSTFFFTIATFAKNCLQQDAFIHLCLDGALVANGTVCNALNTQSSFFDLYRNADYCPGGYPYCICRYASGPFIEDSNNIAPFRASIQGVAGLDIIWSGLFTYPYGPWVIVGVLFLTAFSLQNSLRVQTKVFEMKETALSTRIETLESSNKEKEKRLQKIKAFETRSTLKESFIAAR